MTEATKHAARRSALVVPGSSDRFLAKAPSVDADMFLLDLEDAVAPEEKVAARHRVVEAANDLDFGDRIVAVRLNAWSTPFTVRDVLEIVIGAGRSVDVVMLPKVDRAAEVVALDLLLRQVEIEAGLEPGTIGVEAQIESAAGLADVGAISSSSSRLEAIVLGPLDLAASLGMPTPVAGSQPDAYPGDHFHAVHLALVVAARIAGIQVMDGPYFGLDQPEELVPLARRTRALGFDGKWAIHPSQVAPINSVFTPDPREVEWAESVVKALELAASEGRGAVRHEGQMLDEASKKAAEQVLRRASRVGRSTPESA